MVAYLANTYDFLFKKNDRNRVAGNLELWAA